jgi:hypothetical protein
VCECGEPPRIAFEHNIDCPRRVGFFGAPIEWGVGEYGDIRNDVDRIFIYSGQTWTRLFDMTVSDVIRNNRKKKLDKIMKYE